MLTQAHSEEHEDLKPAKDSTGTIAMRYFRIFAILGTGLLLWTLPQSGSAQTSIFNSTSSGVVTVVPIGPRLGTPGEPNSLGWSTGYSAITTTSERPNLFGRAVGGSDTVVETTTRVVPNDALGNPARYGGLLDNSPNSAGWYTGYSAVTSTYERPDPLGAALGGRRTVTESTTQIVPNDALGQPMRPLLGLWP